MILNLVNFIKHQVPSSNEHKVAVDVRKHFFKKKFIKYLVLHHVLNIKKRDFFEKDDNKT